MNEGDIKFSSENQKAKFIQNYPGCFKKTIAFLIDNVIIALLGMAIFYPFSSFIGSLYVHAWLPGYLIGILYYAIIESSLMKGQSIGKMIFSLKVVSTNGSTLNPLTSVLRYIILTIPLYNGAISGSLATTVGITNTSIGGSVFLILVGVLITGNTLFMLFHPQKRGLHDIFLKSIVTSLDYNETKIISFSLRPLISGAVGFALLALIFGNLFINFSEKPDFSEKLDFSEINSLSENIKRESSINNISATYKIFTLDGKQTSFSINVLVPIPYDKFGDKEYTKALSNKLYPLVKKINTNPKVDTITIIYKSRKYIGTFPISKHSKNPKKIDEI